MSYTTLYGLYALSSLLLFNALILLARYAHQVKVPPQDDDFVRLEEDKSKLVGELEERDQRVVELEMQLKQTEEELKLAQDTQKLAQEQAANAG